MKKNPISNLGKKGEAHLKRTNPQEYREFRITTLLEKMWKGYGTIKDRQELKELNETKII